MRFESKSEPKLGDTRQRLEFAWWPVKIESTTIWLESYAVNEIFAHDGYDKSWRVDSIAMIDPGVFR